MNVYVYAADLYCEDCGEAIREELSSSCPLCDEKVFVSCGVLIDPDDEYSYDSDEFPKGPYPDGGGESDHPNHCGGGEDCINAIELSDGHKIGAFLENPLTSYGYEYIRQAIQEGGEGTEIWADFYDPSYNMR